MNINSDINFGKFMPWRVIKSVNVNSLEREKLLDIQESINADSWMKNYDVEGFVYTTQAPESIHRLKKVKLFIMPSLEYFKLIKRQRPEADIKDYEKTSLSFFLNDELLEEKIRAFMSKHQRYISSCAHQPNHGILYRNRRADIFSNEHTKQLL